MEGHGLFVKSLILCYIFLIDLFFVCLFFQKSQISLFLIDLQNNKEAKTSKGVNTFVKHANSMHSSDAGATFLIILYTYFCRRLIMLINLQSLGSLGKYTGLMTKESADCLSSLF